MEMTEFSSDFILFRSHLRNERMYKSMDGILGLSYVRSKL